MRRQMPLGAAMAILGAWLAHAAAAVIAAAPQGVAPPPPSLTPPMGASAFAEADLRAWLTYLASDDLQGRLAYTEGLGLAGAFIARNLEQWGVAPAGDNNSYFQVVRVLGIRTRSNSSVTVTVNGRSRTFKDGDGVTFARNQGGKQVVSGQAAFVGHGVSFAPIGHDDFARRNVATKVALYIGSKGPAGFSAEHSRLVNARGRNAVDAFGAAAAIGPAVARAPTPAANPNTPRVDFQSAQRLDTLVPPQITAGDDFFAFVLSGSGRSFADLKAMAERQETLPDVALDGVTISIDVDADYEVVQTRLTRNVVGLVRGADAALADTYVMMGAHYDHVGYQQFAPPALSGPDPLIASCPGQSRPTPRPGDIINNGADDDGSGTVGLMAIARAFAQGPRPRRSILFVWHTAEEGGLSGSRYMADHPVVPLDRVAAQLNIDMIGRNRCDDPAEANTVHLVGSDRISTDLHNVNEDANAALPRPLVLSYELNDSTDLESLYTRSDHYSYAAKGVPVTFFTTGLHRDYHYVTDEVDKILFDKLARVSQLAYASAWRLASVDAAPVRDRRGPRMGKGQTGRIAAAQAPNPIPVSVPLPPDAPFTVLAEARASSAPR